MEILEHEEKNEKWASGITTYQITKFKHYPADDGDLGVLSADYDRIVLKKNYLFCTICLCDIRKGELIRELKCSHRFHQKCIDHWLKKKAVCPIDRVSMLG